MNLVELDQYIEDWKTYATSHQHPADRGPTLIETDHRVWDIGFLDQGHFVFGQPDATEASASSRCWSLVAPTMGAVITGLANSQASATQ